VHKTSNLWEFVFEQTVQTNSMNRPTQKSGPENAPMIENGAFMGGQLWWAKCLSGNPPNFVFLLCACSSVVAMWKINSLSLWRRRVQAVICCRHTSVVRGILLYSPAPANYNGRMGLIGGALPRSRSDWTARCLRLAPIHSATRAVAQLATIACLWLRLGTEAATATAII